MSLIIVTPDDRRWFDVWRASEQEPHAHPAYVMALCSATASARCALYSDDGGQAFYPFHLRTYSNGFDLTDAYGYGGPLTIGTPDGAAFWRDFDAWAVSEGVVTQFGRPILFDEGRLPWPDEAVVDQHVVWRLEGNENTLWYDAKHKVRKNVKRARRCGLTFELDVNGEHLDAFLDVYYSTLDRRNAGDAYYFDRGFFTSLVEDAPSTMLFAHVRREGRIVSTELVLQSKTHLYSFLGGTLPEAFPDRANDLLKWEVAMWGLANGKRAFVLGGGTRLNDGIFNYKLAFCPNGARPYRLGRRVLNAALEQAWVDARAAEEPGWTPLDGWFPRYRGSPDGRLPPSAPDEAAARAENNPW